MYFTDDKKPILSESSNGDNMGTSNHPPPPYSENGKYGVPPPAYAAPMGGPPTNQTTRQVFVATPAMMGLNRVICGHCSQPFMFALGLDVPVRCPNCRRTSVLGKAWSTKRAWIFFILGIVFLLLGISITAGTYAYAHEHGGFYFINFGSIIVGIVYLGFAWYYKNMKVSHVESTVGTTA